MFRKFRKFIGTLLSARPRPEVHIGPFEAAAEEISLLEAADRARWEEREARWEAKRRCLGGENAG